MIIVTGAAGFIGSNIVAGLNARGERDILVVDDLADGRKCLNLADLDFSDYLEYDDLLARIESGADLGDVTAVFHQGACSDTTEWDGRYVMDRNYRYSKSLHDWCVARGIPFIYASSASVYGMGPDFVEQRDAERPLNMYAFSKFVFDQYVRARTSASQVAGLRYFNVYGPRESHKGSMASVARHFAAQIKASGECKLFEGTDGYANGEQRRDFIHVDDVHVELAEQVQARNLPYRGRQFDTGEGARKARQREQVPLAIPGSRRTLGLGVECQESRTCHIRGFRARPAKAGDRKGNPVDGDTQLQSDIAVSLETIGFEKRIRTTDCE